MRRNVQENNQYYGQSYTIFSSIPLAPVTHTVQSVLLDDEHLQSALTQRATDECTCHQVLSHRTEQVLPEEITFNCIDVVPSTSHHRLHQALAVRLLSHPGSELTRDGETHLQVHP